MERYGCFYQPPSLAYRPRRYYLPQVGLDVHATILSNNSRTVLTQTFVNSSKDSISEVSYAFPLYEGVSVVDFTCHVRDTVIHGIVKPKQEAKEIYEAAKSEGKTAASLDQSNRVSDVFMTRLGNVPAHGQICVEITVLGELKQDAQTDGLRYTLPNTIAPRYGVSNDDIPTTSTAAASKTSIKVDVIMEKGLVIRSIQSPSHPIKVDLGRTSHMSESTFEPCYASAQLGVGGENVLVKQDFVLNINSDKQDIPSALIETHPTIPNQRALMVSLVPKFGLPPGTPEIVFIIDRSGSMGDKISTLQSALRVFLKSLPLGVHFNIISFGNQHQSLWPRSKPYDKDSLVEALKFTDTVDADMGGTEILRPLKAAVEMRFKDKDLEVLLLTDGQVWDEANIFDFVRKSVAEDPIRFFSLGIGDDASHSLIEGISRAGKGFSQSVMNYEELDKKVIRMLKGALTPHVDDYTLDLHLPAPEDDDFEIIEPSDTNPSDAMETQPDNPVPSQPISLYDADFKEPVVTQSLANLPRLSPPKLSVPAVIQSPTIIPPLYPFIRTTAYILFSSKAGPSPDKITLRATSKYGPLTLDIPVADVGEGETIHQMAAKRAMVDLEEGGGWVRAAKDRNGTLIREKWESRVDELVKAECERLGTCFRVAGKSCSFVAVDTTTDNENVAKTEFTSPPSAPPLPMFMAQCASSGFHRVGSIRPKTAACAPPPPPPMSRVARFTDARGDPSMPPPGGVGFMDTRAMPAGPPPPAPSPSTWGLFGAQLPKKKSRSTSGSLYGAPAFSEESFGALPSATSKSRDDPVTDKVYSLIALQTFDGPWEWSETVLRAIDMAEGETLSRLKKLYQEVSGGNSAPLDGALLRNLLATCLAALFFEKKASGKKDIWELVKNKADDWIKATLGSMSQKDQEVMKKVIDRLGELF